jgi:hypothetical protein
MFMGTVASTVPAIAKCMIDEGYGRYTPCEALYRSKKCFIDEGNGRYTPCEALVKQMKARKKKGLRQRAACRCQCRCCPCWSSVWHSPLHLSQPLCVNHFVPNQQSPPTFGLTCEEFRIR